MIIQLSLTGCHIPKNIMDNRDAFKSISIVNRTLPLQVFKLLQSLLKLILLHQAHSKVILCLEILIRILFLKFSHIGRMLKLLLNDLSHLIIPFLDIQLEQMNQGHVLISFIMDRFVFFFCFLEILVQTVRISLQDYVFIQERLWGIYICQVFNFSLVNLESFFEVSSHLKDYRLAVIFFNQVLQIIIIPEQGDLVFSISFLLLFAGLISVIISPITVRLSQWSIDQRPYPFLHVEIVHLKKVINIENYILFYIFIFTDDKAEIQIFLPWQFGEGNIKQE